MHYQSCLIAMVWNIFYTRFFWDFEVLDTSSFLPQTQFIVQKFRTQYERGCWTRNFNRNWKLTCELVLSFSNIQTTLQKKQYKTRSKSQKLIELFIKKPYFSEQKNQHLQPPKYIFNDYNTYLYILSPKFWFFTMLFLLSYFFFSWWLDLYSLFFSIFSSKFLTFCNFSASQVLSSQVFDIFLCVRSRCHDQLKLKIKTKLTQPKILSQNPLFLFWTFCFHETKIYNKRIKIKVTWSWGLLSECSFKI